MLADVMPSTYIPSKFMPKTRTSLILEKAQKRNLALKSIDPNLAISNGVSVADFSASAQQSTPESLAVNAVMN